MSKFLKISATVIVLLFTVWLTNKITENYTARQSTVLLLDFLDAEYGVIRNNPELSEEFAKVVFTKLSYFYIARISSDEIEGDSIKAVCKMKFDESLSRLLRSEPGFSVLEKYLDELWTELTANFQEEYSDCEIEMPNSNRPRRNYKKTKNNTDADNN